MSRLGNWWRHVRRRGLIAVALRYRSHQFVVTRGELAGPPASDHVGDITFRLATPSDLQRLDELEPYGRGARHRFFVKTENDWLFVACHRDRIVATRRYSRALPEVSRDGHGLMPRVLTLGPGQVWSADTFCLPEYRRQGIAHLLGFFAKRFLASQGYTQHLGSMTVSNAPALRMALHSGVTLAYHVSYVRILFWQRLRVSANLPSKLWDELK